MLGTACASSSWPLSSLTRFSRLRSLSMSFPTLGSADCGAGTFEAAALLVRRSRRRAHRGGRLVDGVTQAIFALRQLEHGDCLSQRTLRLRHTTQLRNFDDGAGADNRVPADAGEVAFFSELEAEAPTPVPAPAVPGGVATDTVAASSCDISIVVVVGAMILATSGKLTIVTFSLPKSTRAEPKAASPVPVRASQACLRLQRTRCTASLT